MSAILVKNFLCASIQLIMLGMYTIQKHVVYIQVGYLLLLPNCNQSGICQYK
jgi:hypothetical protein